MILAILQARMSSTRLPGKVLLPLLGEPMVVRQLERIARARRIDRTVVATSDDPSDDPLAAALEAHGAAVHRGPLNDVLARFAGAVRRFGPADHVVRLTADCPLTDPELIDAVIERHLEGLDLTSNTVPRVFPDGLDVQVVRAELLLARDAQSTDPVEREHVLIGLHYDQTLKQGSVVQDEDQGAMRWTVDHPADFAMVEKVYEALYPNKPDFGRHDVLAFLRAHPDVAALNNALGQD